MSSIVNAKNSRYVSITADGATQYTQNQIIKFYVDESMGYIKGRESYLSFNVLNTSTSRWSFCRGRS